MEYIYTYIIPINCNNKELKTFDCAPKLSQEIPFSYGTWSHFVLPESQDHPPKAHTQRLKTLGVHRCAREILLAKKATYSI